MSFPLGADSCLPGVHVHLPASSSSCLSGYGPGLGLLQGHLGSDLAEVHHFVVYFSGDWDVHWLDFDPWPSHQTVLEFSKPLRADEI